MEELLKHLTEISIRQQQIVEHMATRQGETEREVAALHFTAAQRAPLLDPRTQATQLLPKMTVHDDIEHYLGMFETIGAREDWPREEWARILAPLLTGEPQQAYFSMPARQKESYEELRKEILGRVGLSPIAAAQLFRAWEYNSRLPARAQAAELSRLAHHWLLAGSPSAAQVAERVVVDRYLGALPRPLRQAAGMRNPRTVGELVEAVELAEMTMRREAGERAPPFPRRVYQERRTPEGTQHTVSRSAVPGIQDEPMPTEPPPSPTRAWLAGCAVHLEPPRGAPQTEVSINGRPYTALLDSGSAVSLVQSSLFPPRMGTKARLSITCVHGDTQNVPTRRITLSTRTGTWPLEVGVVRDLPVPILLGRDWPGFDQLLTQVTRPASPAGNRQKRKNVSRGPRRRPVLLASDSARDGESPPPKMLTFSMMCSSTYGV
uniref:SCAN box domain-containing protein n=1 Tax=Cyprinus carpio carpio TaxID=630221 RepID=A0A8C1DCP0_CYPCA